MSIQGAALLQGADLLLKLVAVIVGGWWAYKISPRTYVRRLQLTLNALVIRKEGRNDLVVTIVVKNLSLRDVEITLDRSVLLVSRLKASNEMTRITDPQWELEHAFDYFHVDQEGIGMVPRSIEPGLTIVEERLIELPAGQNDTLLLQLRLVAHKRTYKATKVVATSKS